MALTLKGINTPSGNAGSVATIAGANLFDRVMSRISGAAGKLVKGEQKIASDISADATQGLLQGLDTATAENVGAIRASTNTALEDPMLNRADKAKLITKLNTLDQDIGGRETAADTLTKSRESRATEQLMRGIDRAGFEAQSGGTTQDFQNKLTSIDKAIAGIKDPDARNRARADLRSQAGLNKNTFGSRILNEMPLDKDGVVDQNAFAKKLRQGIGKDFRYSDTEIMQLVKGREDISGVTTAKAVKASRDLAVFNSELRQKEQIAKIKNEPLKDKDVRNDLNALNSQVIKEGWSSFGQDIKDQFLDIQLTAHKAGITFEELQELTSQYGSSDTFLGMSPEGNVDKFEAAIKALLESKRNPLNVPQ